MPKKTETTKDPVLSEVTAIKRLMVLALLRTGASQKEVAAALGVDQSHVSRMFSKEINKMIREASKVAD